MAKGLTKPKEPSSSPGGPAPHQDASDEKQAPREMPVKPFEDEGLKEKSRAATSLFLEIVFCDVFLGAVFVAIVAILDRLLRQCEIACDGDIKVDAMLWYSTEAAHIFAVRFLHYLLAVALGLGGIFFLVLHPTRGLWRSWHAGKKKK
jgi:hypothetical protein